MRFKKPQTLHWPITANILRIQKNVNKYAHHRGNQQGQNVKNYFFISNHRKISSRFTESALIHTNAFYLTVYTEEVSEEEDFVTTRVFISIGHALRASADMMTVVRPEMKNIDEKIQLSGTLPVSATAAHNTSSSIASVRRHLTKSRKT